MAHDTDSAAPQRASGLMPKVPGKIRGRRPGLRVQGIFHCQTCHHPDLARIDFLCASGAAITPTAAQFGLSARSLGLHFQNHVTDRYKKIIGASRLETFEKLMEKAAEGGADTMDILDLLIRGHSQMWSVALTTGATDQMVKHANKVLAATELRSKITKELVPGPSLQVNNYLMHDAAQIVNVLHEHPEAAEAILQWHRRRTDERAIEHAAAA